MILLCLHPVRVSLWEPVSLDEGDRRYNLLSKEG